MRSRARRSVAIGVAVYTCVLAFAIRDYVSPVYRYQGFVADNLTLSSLGLSAMMALIPALAIPLDPVNVAANVLWFLFMALGVSSIVFSMTSGLVPFGTGIVYAAAVVVGFLLASMGTRGRVRTRRSALVPSSWFFGILYVHTIVAFALIFAYRGLSLRLDLIANLTGPEIYEVRAASKSAASAGPPIVSYLLAWQADVVNPTLLVIAAARRKMSTFVAALAGQVLLFSLTAQKHFLFVFGVGIVAYRIGRSSPTDVRRLGRMGRVMTAMFLSLVVVSSAIQAITGSITWSTLLTRRTFSAPGMLYVRYLQYFEGKPKTYFSDSLLRGIVRSPYKEDPPSLIARAFFEKGGNANAGIFADGFAKLGWPGIIAMALALAILLWLLNLAAAGADRRLANVVGFLGFFQIANTGLPTTIVSHGLALAIVLLYIAPRAPGELLLPAAVSPAQRPVSRVPSVLVAPSRTIAKAYS